MTPQSQMTSNETWWELATQWSVIRRGITYAIIVGNALIVINHCDAIIRRDFTLRLLVKMVLTVIVPYLVSTFSSVGALRRTSVTHRSET